MVRTKVGLGVSIAAACYHRLRTITFHTQSVVIVGLDGTLTTRQWSQLSGKEALPNMKMSYSGSHRRVLRKGRSCRAWMSMRSCVTSMLIIKDGLANISPNMTTNHV